MDDVYDLIQNAELHVRIFYESIMYDSDTDYSSSYSVTSDHTDIVSSSLDNTSMTSSDTELDVMQNMSTTASAGSSISSRRRDLINDFPDVLNNSSSSQMSSPEVSNNVQSFLSVENVPVEDQNWHNSVEILDEVVPSQPDDDEVIFVSSNVHYIDLCTPTNNNRLTAAPRRNRRSLPTALSLDNIENVSPPKRRAIEVKKVETNLSPSQDKETFIQCPICLENLAKREPTMTKCGHVFCSGCIREALRITNQCPICRTRQRLTTLKKLHI